MNTSVEVRDMEVGMSKAIDTAKVEARVNIEALVKAMGQWGPFELLAAIDAAYATLELQEIEHEIQASGNETTTCPACGENLTTLVEYEKASDTVSESDVLAGRKLILDEPMPNFSDHVAWFTPCCATRVSLADGWLFDTND